MSSETQSRTCASCGEGAGLTVVYHYQDKTFDYCLSCAPKALTVYAAEVEAAQ